jgi:ornithine decarboxylase
MSLSRFRTAVAPLRRIDATHPQPFAPADLPTVEDVVAVERPEDPLVCLRPATIETATRRFVQAFPGKTLYAVKCNPEPAVLRAVRAGGVDRFDCASPSEVRLVRQLFGDAVTIHYMHPVKAPGAIREAWMTHGVRDFAIDDPVELTKILEVLQDQDRGDLGLIVRLRLPKGGSRYDLSGKFGADRDTAVTLLRAGRLVAKRLGVSFHVGSQCLDPAAWARAIERAAAIVAEAGVAIDVLDVGGGFPVAYPDMAPEHLTATMAEIEAALERHGFLDRVEVWAEPGRALVAGGASVVVQVQLRRGAELFVSDGVYGTLSDAGTPGFRFPVRAIAADGGRRDAADMAFSFWGPTCDSADHMAGPFMLPADIAVGDWIEIGQLGAYGTCLRTGFNGFDRVRVTEVRDRPLLATPGLDD